MTKVTQVTQMNALMKAQLDTLRFDADARWMLYTSCPLRTHGSRLKNAKNWIRVTLVAHYVTDFEQIDVVNGKTAVESGLMDFDIAGKPFRGHKVLFADLNGRGALIGSDVLNSGKLDMECGRSISFAHH